ncbi:hypothetical protein DL96DRAFT_1535635 [Flagelloscypha sp. PMI_526]|nr:hypothetical protein DL96DRAFT_1535635 [Flagelloscypha sp. PMI_526]
MVGNNTAIVTGYYRWTDIKMEWKDAIPDTGDGNPLAAVLSYEGLCHPDSPLHIDGIDGIQLYHGTFANGESRLLFSSKQVDYIRYWLHAMKLTKEMLPMPYSTCMLTASNLKHIAPSVYKTADDLKKGFKTMDKINKKLKGTDPLLKARRTQFNQVQEAFKTKKGSWLALDFEAWEKDHTCITEFGYSSLSFSSTVGVEGRRANDVGHFIVKERQQYRNGTEVEDNMDNFDFGESQIVGVKRFSRAICDLIETYKTPDAPLFLVFHNYVQDMKYLLSSDIEAPITGYSYTLPDSPPTEGIYILDTAELFAALEGDDSLYHRSLETMCRLLELPTAHLHNAGNDAHYTLLSFESMVGGENIDEQRKRRWPNREVAKLKIRFQPYDEDPEYDDQEGVLGIDRSSLLS